ncbi:hypothetical protein PRUPE_1G369100 [Prunus persica]|uniref:Uncharacterized protein n=1 Tax=Prunus persica TaxID=3760 RepID=A0A251RBH6_PRUPE|nr:hypothetical protein PRUPE_1G369100 [Prunus persica]
MRLCHLPNLRKAISLLLVESKAQFFHFLSSYTRRIRPSTVRSTETVQEKVQVFRSLPLEFNTFKQKTQRNQWFLTVVPMDAIKKVMQTSRSTMIKMKVLPWVSC